MAARRRTHAKLTMETKKRNQNINCHFKGWLLKTGRGDKGSENIPRLFQVYHIHAFYLDLSWK